MKGFTQQQMVNMSSYDKLLVELGEKFGILWDDPTDLDNWTDFLTHVGKIGFGLIDMLSSFDKTVGTALGITAIGIFGIKSLIE